MAHDKKPLYMRNHRGELIDAEKATYAPDGMVSGDWRKVRPGGRVKFLGWWQSDKLKEYVGKWVWCEVNEYWHTATEVYHDRPGMRGSSDYFKNLICTAESD